MLCSSRHLSLAAALGCVAAVPAQTPIIGQWSLDETSGFVAADSGPIGNTGTLVSFTNDPAQWVPGVFGNALAFDGIDDYVDIAFNGGLPFYDGLGAAFSVTFWVRANAADDDRVLSLSSTASNTPLFTIGSGQTALGLSDRIRIYVRSDGNRSFDQSSDQTVFDGTWHHVAYCETSGRANLYVDGVRDTAGFDFRGAGPSNPNYGTFTLNRLTLGAVVRSTICCLLPCELDDVRVFGYELTAADVATIRSGGGVSSCRASLSSYGQGCGAGPLDLYALGSAQLGGPGISFAMRGGLPNAVALLCVGIGPLAPLDLGPLGFGGCRLYPASGSCLTIGALDPTGSSPGLIPFPIPNVPALGCLRVGFQSIAFAGTTADFSNAIVAVLGS
ncbi:MAG: LamG domain-containing protein [Planctomycetes bacterium]|nr:LamG domain-containing protein [Planctomycetota bacterium]